MITEQFFYATLDMSALLFGAFGLILLYIARDVERWPKGLCVAILISTIACAAVGLLGYGAEQADAPYALMLAQSLAETLIAPIPSLLVFAYFVYCSGRDFRKNAVVRAECILTGALIVAGCLAKLSGEARIVAGQEPHFGPWIALSFALMIALEAINLITLVRYWKDVTTVQGITFLACFLAAPSIQVILVELLLSIGLVRRYLDQKEETAQERARVAVLQMRPHFIHNTLTSIYYLIAKDSEKARQTTLDFSRYLQNNFEAIAEEGTIPFEKELEHTKAYLAVEQACYEGRVFAEFDTPVTSFCIPPLTLQPIVENAVKHGMDPDSEPLHVSVATRDLEHGVQITVEDNGPGFTPPDDEEPHFALDNVRERLKAQCGGTLEIAACETGGARVVVFIPQESKRY